MIRRTWWIFLAMVIGLAACSDGSDSGNTRLLEMGDDLSSIEVAVGDVVDVALPANPSTGYSWEVVAIDPAVLSLGPEPVFESDSDLIGAGGTMTFSFDVVGAGTTTIEMVYHRTFESNPPENTFTLTVVAD